MIGLELAGYTELVGTAKTQLNGGSDIILPAWARSIVAIEVAMVLETPVTAEQTVIAAAMLESDDFNISPFEVLANPIGAVLTEGGGQSVKKERYAVNAAVNGGDRLRVYGQEFSTTTDQPEMAVAIIISSEPPAFTQKHARIGTMTNTGAVDGDTAGSAYTFTAGHRIVELVGMVTPEIMTTVEGFAGYIRFESSEFGAPVPLKLLLNPVQSAITTGEQSVPEVTRQEIDVPVRSPTTIQDYLNLATTSATAVGQWISGVIYE